MGQAKARGTKESRIAEAVESAKLLPPKKKLSKRELNAFAMRTALGMFENLIRTGKIV